MRIEKINEKQIRCTLNQKDLKDREIGISELAYGTAKARALFRDMMEQASYELGFDANDIPLMIEAIPLLPEALILIITKVEEPDELDPRFSCFTEERDGLDAEDFLYDDYDYEDEDEEDFMGFVTSNDDIDSDSEWTFPGQEVSSNLVDTAQHSRISSEPDFITLPEALGMEPRPRENKPSKVKDIVMIFSFTDLEAVTQLACHIDAIYREENTLYKDTATGTYYLVLHRSSLEAEEFGKVCNILYEYGTAVKNTGSVQHYYEEHYKPIIARNAIRKLARL